jgi:hypothetical protein
VPGRPALEAQRLTLASSVEEVVHDRLGGAGGQLAVAVAPLELLEKFRDNLAQAHGHEEAPLRKSWLQVAFHPGRPAGELAGRGRSTSIVGETEQFASPPRDAAAVTAGGGVPERRKTDSPLWHCGTRAREPGPGKLHVVEIVSPVAPLDHMAAFVHARPQSW